MIAAYDHSHVNISASKFYDGRGRSGGCILLSGSSSAEIGQSEFSNCAAQLGGAIYSDGSEYLTLIENEFYDNIAY